MSSSHGNTTVGDGGDVIIRASDGVSTGETGITAGTGGDLYLRAGNSGKHIDGGTAGSAGNI